MSLCQEQTLELYKDVGSMEQKVESVREQKQEYVDLQEEYSAYDLYMRCMHTSGIAYDIIKTKTPSYQSGDSESSCEYCRL